MKVQLPVDDINKLTPIIEEAGTFKKIDKASVEKQDGYFVTVLVAKYSDDNRVFTISFNDDEEVVGLYIK